MHLCEVPMPRMPFSWNVQGNIHTWLCWMQLAWLLSAPACTIPACITELKWACVVNAIYSCFNAQNLPLGSKTEITLSMLYTNCNIKKEEKKKDTNSYCYLAVSQGIGLSAVKVKFLTPCVARLVIGLYDHNRLKVINKRWCCVCERAREELIGLCSMGVNQYLLLVAEEWGLIFINWVGKLQVTFCSQEECCSVCEQAYYCVALDKGRKLGSSLTVFWLVIFSVSCNHRSTKETPTHFLAGHVNVSL